MSEPQDNSNFDEGLAFKRFMVLNVIRVIGVLSVCAGIAVQERLLTLPPVFAYVLVIAGFLIFFFLPNRIANGWRSKDT